MKTKFFQSVLAAAILITLVFPAVQTFGALKANPTGSTVLVDSKSTTFDSYNINDFNM